VAAFGDHVSLVPIGRTEQTEERFRRCLEAIPIAENLL